MRGFVEKKFVSYKKPPTVYRIGIFGPSSFLKLQSCGLGWFSGGPQKHSEPPPFLAKEGQGQGSLCGPQLSAAVLVGVQYIVYT